MISIPRGIWRVSGGEKSFNMEADWPGEQGAIEVSIDDTSRDRLIVSCHDLALLLDDIHPGWDRVTVSKDANGGYHVIVDREKKRPPVETEGR